ncbi:M48 family metalloprotease [Thermoleptolyngbya sp. M55_K2018_002]|uniref:M48 family metalloprotease n=1 Tax=Thermoleptolyngbya sp. M55_K2018_002 TaxID=2747808 RepID=UPI001A05D36C|nr:M48 family metalloprotease [Thermoleptolyngbya sp. M55_K2018_002]HIK40901.1 M48 family metalloprotease [Thermoleptolyngbya sp. M55_K2018_002]
MAGINQFKTLALLALLSGLIVLAGYLLVGDETGLYYGLAFAALSSFGSWYYSDQAALAAFQAKPTPREEAPALYDRIEKLCDRAGLPMPAVYIVPSESPNAFATGRDPNHAAIALTEGIIKLLPPDELDAVIAHELTHVRNRDTLTQAVAGTLAGSLTYLGRILTLGALYFPVSRAGRRGNNPLAILFLLVVGPMAAGLIQMAISRTREFAADAGAAEITGDPLALVRALEALEATGQKVPIHGNPAFAPLFIVNPLSREGLMTLFMTHPPVEERIKRLKEMAAQAASSETNPPTALSPSV